MDTDRQSAAFFWQGVKVGTDYCNLSIFDVVAGHFYQLKAGCTAAAELNKHVALADGFSLEGGTMVDGDVDFDVSKLDTPDFKGNLDNLVIIRFGYEPIGNLLIFSQRLVRNNRETGPDSASAGSILNKVMLAQIQDKGKNTAALVIPLGITETGFDTAKHHTSPQGVVGSVYNLGKVAQRECDVIDTDLDVFFQQLLNNLVTEEEHQAFTHHIIDNLFGQLAVPGPPDDNSLTGDSPVNHLDTVGTYNRVAEKTGPGRHMKRFGRVIIDIAEHLDNVSGIPCGFAV